jgi:hypothetical protein
LILIQHETGQVVQLDQATHLFLRLLAREQTISQALASLAAVLEEPVDEAAWHDALRTLTVQGWIVLPQSLQDQQNQEAPHPTEKEGQHV